MADRIYQTINPTTEEVTFQADLLSADELEHKLSVAVSAFERNKSSSFARRADSLNDVADRLEQKTDEYSRIITREMGKPREAARSEIEKCAWLCRHIAKRASGFLAPETVETDASRSYVTYQPLGPVLAIMPWNFPFWQAFRFAAPAIMAGNVGLLKHASNVPQSAREITNLFNECYGYQVFQNLFVDTETIGDIIADDRIRAVTLTGSVRAGSAVAEQAGREIKKTVLELGGSDPFIVLSDADIDRAVEVGVDSRMLNNGQSCIAAKRFILEEPIASEFTERFVEKVEALTVGDPMESRTEIGPMARKDLRDQLHDQVQRSIADGAKLACGGHPLDRTGTFYAPTVLTNVQPGMAAFDDETFGPVAAVTTAENVEEACHLANSSPYGLGAAVFTSDRSVGEELALKLEAGNTFVNGLVKSDPRLPFGGIKQSGYGRELSRWGIREFVNTKTIWID